MAILSEADFGRVSVATAAIHKANNSEDATSVDGHQMANGGAMAQAWSESLRGSEVDDSTNEDMVNQYESAAASATSTTTVNVHILSDPAGTVEVS